MIGIQNKLGEWKLEHACVNSIEDCTGSAGNRHWNGFKRRNSHRILTKKGETFDPDRQNWITYSNFLLMHDNINQDDRIWNC